MSTTMASIPPSGSIRGFADAARGLARNPLGVIALFIVLIYGLSTVAFSTSSSLTGAERLTFVVFLCVYPFAVLISFCWLVAHHHAKLYAPGDFRTEKNFFGPQPIPQQQQREIEEAKAIAAGSQLKPTDSALRAEGGERSSTNSNRDRMQVARTEYRLAEEYAMRDLEAQIGVPILRRVVIKNKEAELPVDGLLSGSSVSAIVEIKLLNRPLDSDFIERVFVRARACLDFAKEVRPDQTWAFILVVVVQDTSMVREADILLQFYTEGQRRKFFLDVRAMSFQVLRRRFEGLDGSGGVE